MEERTEREITFPKVFLWSVGGLLTVFVGGAALWVQWVSALLIDESQRSARQGETIAALKDDFQDLKKNLESYKFLREKIEAHIADKDLHHSRFNKVDGDVNEIRRRLEHIERVVLTGVAKDE